MLSDRDGMGKAKSLYQQERQNSPGDSTACPALLV